MLIDFNIIKYSDEYLEQVTSIFNTFAKDSYALYYEEELSVEYIKSFISNTRIALLQLAEGKVIGAGFITPYKPAPNFNHSGVLTYFILPNYTNKGLGSKLMDRLISDGKSIGITNYFAHISSKNEQSINFHKKHHFEEVGRFKNIGTKFGNFIDIIWMQKQF